MHASLFFLSALGASVWAAPTYPRIDADASVPDSIRTVSEYFNLLATKVRESRLQDAVPVCDLSHLSLPAGTVLHHNSPITVILTSLQLHPASHHRPKA
jgi:hypothetical protein